jgi:hypothetical protein
VVDEPVLRVDKRTQAPFVFWTSTATRFAPSGIDTEIELWLGNTVSVASIQVGPGDATAGETPIAINKSAQRNENGFLTRRSMRNIFLIFIRIGRRWQTFYLFKNLAVNSDFLKRLSVTAGFVVHRRHRPPLLGKTLWTQ